MYDVTQARPVCHEAVRVCTAYTRDQLLLAESADEQCLRCGCSSPSCAVVPCAADIDGPRHTRLSCAHAGGDSGAYTPYCSGCWSCVCVCLQVAEDALFLWNVCNVSQKMPDKEYATSLCKPRYSCKRTIEKGLIIKEGKGKRRKEGGMRGGVLLNMEVGIRKGAWQRV